MPSTYTNLLYHIIFSTKERRPFINPALRDELHPYIGGIIRDAEIHPESGAASSTQNIQGGTYGAPEEE
jgi:hypothetical protein